MTEFVYLTKYATTTGKIERVEVEKVLEDGFVYLKGFYGFCKIGRDCFFNPADAIVKRDPAILPERLEYLLDDLKTEQQAVMFAIQRAGRTQTVVGEELGLQKSHWSGIVNGKKNMSWNLKQKFCDLLGNDILLQWYAWRRGYRLVKREPSEQEKLAAENEALKARLAEMEKRA